ncbi:MAG: putative bifunctional diguanylate cyclase/phosphodiesterase, partial [Gammaproteobacteria bacterium]
AVSNAIVITGRQGRDTPIEYVNPAFERITGYTLAEVIGRDSRFMAAPGMDLEERARVREAVRTLRSEQVVFRNRRKNGELFWNELTITPVQDEFGQATHFIGVISDITETRQRTAALEHEVNHDPLTGLANRTLMWDRLDQAIHLAQRQQSMVATVLIDLDGFKQINDTFGHEAGDQVLVAVARQLQAAVRDIDTVARLSGDEFVLILTNQPSLSFTANMADRLHQGISRPVSLNGSDVHVSASVGIAMYPHDGATPFELMRAADAAMYHAKAGGKSDISFFSATMKSATEAKQRMESAMRAALDNHQLYLVYQPRFSIEQGRLVAVEALVRWRHPDRGILLPSAFLPDAEENGLIVQIGDYVLDGACALLRELREQRHEDVIVSVNACYKEFSQHHYISRVAAKLHEYELDPDRLELELREDHLARNLPLSSEVAEEMKALGMRLAVDNFGDGVISLHYLHTHRIHHIKLHRNAMRMLETDARETELARTLIAIGRNLNIGVVAQGVETLSQLNFVKASGCAEIQGRYVSDPLTREGLQRLLEGVATA